MSSLTRSRTRRAAPIAAAALLLTACATEEEPTPIFAEPTATVTPKAEPAPKDPHRSPKSLIRHWNQVQNESQRGDTTIWRNLTAECGACISFADQVDEIYAAGGFISTDGRRIKSIQRDPDFSSGVYLIDVESAPTEYRLTQGSTKESMAGGTTVYRVHLTQTGDRWDFRDYEEVVQ